MEAARPAAAGDLPRLAELCRLVRSEMAPLRGGSIFVDREARGEPIESELAAALDDDDQCVLAGTVDDFVVGYAVGRVESLRSGVVLGVIEDLFVEGGARAVGVGEALTDHLLQWFSARKVVGIDAYALPGDRNTKNFFEMSGFTARLLVMHHKMADHEQA